MRMMSRWQVFGQVFSEDQDAVHLTCDEQTERSEVEVYHFSELRGSKFLVCSVPLCCAARIGVRANPGSNELCFEACCWEENGVLRVEACDAELYGWFWLRCSRLDEEACVPQKRERKKGR